MPNIAERLETAVARWIEQGRGEEGLLEGWEYMRVYCWLHTKTGEPYFAKEDIKAYFKASQEHFGQTGYVHLLHHRAFCQICGTRYRVENIRICTECERCYCYGCQRSFEHNNYGDPLCPCGGVIVG